MKTTASSLEVLEPRIAPASVLHYIDVDGDKVTVTSSVGDLTSNAFFDPSGHQLEMLNLVDPSFDHANLIFSAVKVPGGDGLVNVGFINGGTNDFGKIQVSGDLARIDVGSNSATVPAIKSLAVRSMGRLGTDTPGGGILESDIFGALGALKVSGDVKDEFIKVFTLPGGTNATIGSITIGGSLIGGDAHDTGEISSDNDMGVVKIGHDVQGGSGGNSGLILSRGGKLAGVTIGGSLVGDAGGDSGEIKGGGDIGAVKIGHDMRGGSGINSGLIATSGKLAGVTIGGSLVGGAGGSSGEIGSIGDMGAVKIGHDMQGGSGSDSGLVTSNGKLAGVTLGGSLLGGSNGSSGEIGSIGDMGAIKIGHDVLGGSGGDSALIVTRGKLAGVSIGGSLVGGSGGLCGAISSSGDMGVVTVGHDVLGGSSSASGVIEAGGGKLAGVTIDGSLIGGVGDFSGGILSFRDMGAVKIGQDMQGGSITGSASLDQSGFILSQGRIASVAVGGSILSGTDDSSGSLTRNATIGAGKDIGSLTVQGGIIGNVTTHGASLVVINALGQEFPSPGIDLAIGRLTVGGRVELANILAGREFVLNTVNGDAQIGPVKVGGDWIASNLVAGAQNLGADDAPGGSGANADNLNYGDSHDFSLGVGSTNIVAKIASITIAGQVFGTPDSTSTTDHFGFVAEHIGKVKIGGNTIALPTDHTPLAIGETADVGLHVIA